MRSVVKEVLRRVERTLEGLEPAQRRKVLEDSIALYERNGHAEVATALRTRLEQEPEEVASLTTARVTRDAPETVAEFASFVSLEGSAGCTAEGCGAFILGVEVGILSARLDNNPQEWNGTYHAENEGMLARVASAKGYGAAFEKSVDGAWLFGTFTPTPVRPKLAIVRPNEEEK